MRHSHRKQPNQKKHITHIAIFMGYHCVDMPQYTKTAPVSDDVCPVLHDDAMKWSVLLITGLSTGSFDFFYVVV